MTTHHSQAAADRPDVDRVFVRASRISPVTFVGSVSAIGSLVLLTDGSVGPAVAGALIAIGSIALVIAHVRRAGAWLDPDGVTVRGVLLRRRIEWAQIATIRTEHIIDRTAVGDRVRYLDWRGRELTSPWWTVLLAGGSSWRFSAYLGAHGLDIPVDPPEDPRVRDELWRQPPFEHDPFESIRTVRRAVVGPFVVMVRPRGDRFVALTLDERTGEQVVFSDDRASLESAIEAAVEQIRDVQRRTASEG